MGGQPSKTAAATQRAIDEQRRQEEVRRATAIQEDERRRRIARQNLFTPLDDQIRRELRGSAISSRVSAESQSSWSNNKTDFMIPTSKGVTVQSNNYPNRSVARRSTVSEKNQASGSNNKKEFKIPTSEVLMPSGITFTITLPSKPKCFCKEFRPTKLINIWPNSRISPGEHQMICDQMNSTIKQHVTGAVAGYHIITIQKVKNCCVWTKYRNRKWDILKETGENNINERMLFHGSVAADDIVQRGFDERHSDAGGMFGAGVYFAEHSSKSNQYVFGRVGSGCANHLSSECTACERKIILCRVVLGNTLIRTSADKMSHPPPGYHSVKGSPSFQLKYPEYVIYRGEQAYPEYLITYKCRN